jgi:tetratricopeptide (TPR) repeat protein
MKEIINRKHWKYLFLITTFMVLLPIIIFAQDGSGQGGTRSNFTFGFGARAMGMGNAYVAMADDPTAVYWNPAGLDYVYQQSLTIFHASLPEGGLYDFLGYAYPTLDLGTFAIGIGRIGTGDIDQYDMAGQKVGSTFSYDNYRLYLSYGLKLPYNISAGLSIKILRQGFYNLSLVEYSWDVNATGVGMDLGILYKLKLGDITDVIPLALRFGLMRTIPIAGTGAFNILLDLDKSSTTDLGIFFGTEFNYQGIGKVRVGYNNSSIAFGVGVEYKMFQIDYAFGNPSYDAMLPPIHRISLTVNFGMNRDEMFEIVEQLRLEEEERLTAEIREADKQKFIAEHLQKADAYFEENQYLDAIVEYQQVIGADPFHQRAKIMLDSTNTLLASDFQTQQNEAVLAALDRDRAESDARFVNEHYDQGRLYLDQKQYTKALIEFNLALQRDPDNQQVLAGIQTTRRRLNEDLNALMRKGRSEMSGQNYSEALRLFSEARLLAEDDTRVKKEVDTLVERVKLQESIQQGIMLYDIGQYDQALQIFENVLANDPQNQFIQQYYRRTQLEALAVTEPMDPETERRYLQGVELFLLSKYRDAIGIWEEILKDHPYNKKVLEAINGAQDRIKRTESQQD